MVNTITTDLIEAINKQTPVSIDLVPLGYAWSWKCVESAPFPSPQLALIDWINYICRACEEVLIESLRENESKHMKWRRIDPSNLPSGEVLAANFQPKTRGCQEKLLGYLGVGREGWGVSCESENELLTNCTHYIDINAFDLGELVGEKDDPEDDGDGDMDREEETDWGLDIGKEIIDY